MPKETLTNEKKSTPTENTVKSDTTRPVGTKISVPVLRLETRRVPNGS